jgi:hypothetical protein
MLEECKWMLWKGPQTREYVLIDWRAPEFSVQHPLHRSYAVLCTLYPARLAPVISHIYRLSPLLSGRVYGRDGTQGSEIQESGSRGGKVVISNRVGCRVWWV